MLTATLRLHYWTYGIVAVVVFALIKEFVIDMFGNEHDSCLSSLIDFALRFSLMHFNFVRGIRCE